MTGGLVEERTVTFADLRPGDCVLLGGQWETVKSVTVTVTVHSHEPDRRDIDPRDVDVPHGVAFFEAKPDVPVKVRIPADRVQGRLLQDCAAVQEAAIDRSERRTG